MSFLEIFKFAFRGIGANKLRSGLTMLGILIGVAAVILLVAVGNGSAQTVADRHLMCHRLVRIGRLFERLGIVYADWSYSNSFWHPVDHRNASSSGRYRR